MIPRTWLSTVELPFVLVCALMTAGCDPDEPVATDFSEMSRNEKDNQMYDRFPDKFGFRPILAPCRESDIVKTEEALCTTFPPEYRAFLEQRNGGTFHSGDVRFPIKDSESEIKRATVKYLFGVGPARTMHMHILGESGTGAFESPPNVIPIGRNMASYLYLSLTGPNRGKVYFCPTHDDTYELPSYERLRFVANNFDEFWQSLQCGVEIQNVHKPSPTSNKKSTKAPKRFPEKFGFRPILAPCWECDIAETEEALGTRLPAEYREFLEQHNGGIFLPADHDKEVAFRIRAKELEDDYGTVRSLFGVGPTYLNHILEERTRRGFTRIPSNLIPIGHKTHQYYLCLSVSGPDRGTIYYCPSYLDWEDEEYEPSYDILRYVAADFDQFWQSLYLREEDPPIVFAENWDEWLQSTRKQTGEDKNDKP